MAGIFINYRADDNAYAAGAVDERLRHDFGDRNVFLDQRSLQEGADFRPELWRRLRESSVLLVLIGPRWLTLADGSGARRIDDPQDFVRREIRTALKWRKSIIMPVLLTGAASPRPEDLPHDIASLANRQSIELRDGAMGNDLDRLVKIISAHVPRLKTTASTYAPTHSSSVNIAAGRLNIEGDVIGGNSK